MPRETVSVSGEKAADPAFSLRIVRQYARFLIFLSEDGYTIRENAQGSLRVIAFIYRGELVLEIGFEHTRPFRRAYLPKAIRPRTRHKEPLPAFLFPTVLEAFRNVLERILAGCYQRYRYQHYLGKHRRYWWGYNGSGKTSVVPAKVVEFSDEDGEEYREIDAYRKERCLRGVTISVAQEDKDLAYFLFFCRTGRKPISS
mgnify:FL=1